MASIHVEIQRLASENTEQGKQLTEQKYDIEHLTSQNKWQQILLDEQRENIDQVMSNNDDQQNAIQILSMENVKQETQLDEHQLEIVRFTTLNFCVRLDFFSADRKLYTL